MWSLGCIWCLVVTVVSVVMESECCVNPHYKCYLSIYDWPWQ